MNNMKVTIWQEQVTIPTYRTGTPDKNPMFFENRVYQGSSGTVYPNPVIEKIEDEKVDQEYIGLFLENTYVKIMILPELGGRVQMAFDKIANRHFIYYNQVIKPALVGLCGPWISGGIEFNWPQHHRPSTFDPIDFRIEENKDGSKTVWVSEVEKMFRTKGMAGFTLHPDRAYLEIKAQLYNRTDLPQTFLWWANPAVVVNNEYQSIFPPDVNAVFDHGKRDVSTFPIATGTYYKVDYSPGTDISRYKNIPVPTSYMAVNSDYNFVGGYEHDIRAGVIHVADHHISPGKKQWTWGNGDFGIAWDRNLTDEDGPYIELMTGMFTDNQPDFTWLMPNEEKSFTQYFIPYREVGMVKNATKDILLGLEKAGDKLFIRVFGTSPQTELKLSLFYDGKSLLEEAIDIRPEIVYEKTLPFERDFSEEKLLLSITDNSGKVKIKYAPTHNSNNAIPDPAKPALQPAEIESTEQLFLTGQHLEQYRHATYSPVPYYEEALKRDFKDIRNNNALGVWYLRRGKFNKSETYFRQAITTSIERNPNPYDSEPYYNLGLSLIYQKKINEAYDAFFKAAWSSAWQDSAYFSVAKIDIIRKDYELALEHIDWALDKNARNGKAYLVKIHALRKLDKVNEAIEVANSALTRDGFNLSALFELYKCYVETKDELLADNVSVKLLELSRGNAHTLIEYAIEFAALGLYEDAIELLQWVDDTTYAGPMVKYYMGFFWHLTGAAEQSDVCIKEAASMPADYCFPNRLDDILVLEYALERNSQDAKAAYYLGNLWFDKKQYENAIDCWQRSSAIDDSFPTVLRNLGIAVFNKIGDHKAALEYFEKAFNLNQADARILMELDQLYKRLNFDSPLRLALLKKHQDTSEIRDDIYLEIAALHNFAGDYEVAYEHLMNRKFHPWEGGEGKVSWHYIYCLVEMAKVNIEKGDYNKAITHLDEAQEYPHNLGEGKLPGAQENDIFYWLGRTYLALNDTQKANYYLNKAKTGLSEPSAAMFYNDQQPDKIFYQGLALEELNEKDAATAIFTRLVTYGDLHKDDDVRLDYFAVSLPDLLIFEDDLKKRNNIHCKYIFGLGLLGLKEFKRAEAAFLDVLKDDSMHFGAMTHIKLIPHLKEKQVLAAEMGKI
jgi:tetratricopeptide (TPR) repeat protein